MPRRAGRSHRPRWRRFLDRSSHWSTATRYLSDRLAQPERAPACGCGLIKVRPPARRCSPATAPHF